MMHEYQKAADAYQSLLGKFSGKVLAARSRCYPLDAGRIKSVVIRAATWHTLPDFIQKGVVGGAGAEIADCASPNEPQ